MNVLVTGADGQLGMELRDYSKMLEAVWEFTDVGELDITDRDMVLRHLTRTRPDVVINAAAYTAVDQAENEPELAKKINVDGPQFLSEACRSLGSRLVHISTDFVFDGNSPVPYTEDAEPHPLGVYGSTKLEGERAVFEHSARGVVVRTSWLYSKHGKNFVKTMIKLAEQRDELKIVDDQVGSPTWARDLARTILAIIPKLENTEPVVFHYSNTGAASWYDLTRAIVDSLDVDCKVTPISSTEYPTPAKRPSQSRLNSRRICDQFGVSIPYWRDSLANCLNDMRKGGIA